MSILFISYFIAHLFQIYFLKFFLGIQNFKILYFLPTSFNYSYYSLIFIIILITIHHHFQLLY